MISPRIADRFDRCVDAFRRHPLALVIAIIASELVFSGVRPQDHGLGTYYGAVLSNSTHGVPPERQFLLESVLPDEIGSLLTSAGLHGFELFWIWWALGLAMLAFALFWAVRAGRLSLGGLAALIAFTRITDTLSLWIFKSDPYLLAFVVFSFTASSAIAAVAFTILAGLCHPSLAFLSAFGIFIVDSLLQNQLRWRWLIGAVLALLVGEMAAHLLVGAINGRLENNLLSLQHTVIKGVITAPQFVLGTVLIPLGGLSYIAITRKTDCELTRILPVGLWIAFISLFSMILVQDHTRVFTLALFGVFVFCANHLISKYHAAYWADRIDVAMILLLFLARLTSPHIDFSGARTTELGGLFH